MKLCNDNHKDLNDSEMPNFFRAVVQSGQYALFNYLNRDDGEEFLYLYLKRVFKKNPFIKNTVFWKKNEKQNEVKLWTFGWVGYTWKGEYNIFSDTV